MSSVNAALYDFEFDPILPDRRPRDPDDEPIYPSWADPDDAVEDELDVTPWTHDLDQENDNGTEDSQSR